MLNTSKFFMAALPTFRAYFRMDAIAFFVFIRAIAGPDFVVIHIIFETATMLTTVLPGAIRGLAVTNRYGK